MHILTEWQIKGWIDAAVRSKADSHEVHSLIGRVDSLEHSLREARAENDGLRARIEEIQANVERLHELMMQNANA